MLLAGDIGGTKTILAAYTSDTSSNRPLAQKQYCSTDYLDLETMMQQFLEEIQLPNLVLLAMA